MLEKVRTIILFEEHFKEFMKELDKDVRNKINDVLYLIQVYPAIPAKFFKKIENVKGLFEIRIEFQSNIYRIFCCFDSGQLVILFNAFQKKTNKTPKNEILLAEKLMKQYFQNKKQDK